VREVHAKFAGCEKTPWPELLKELPSHAAAKDSHWALIGLAE